MAIKLNTSKHSPLLRRIMEIRYDDHALSTTKEKLILSELAFQVVCWESALGWEPEEGSPIGSLNNDTKDDPAYHGYTYREYSDCLTKFNLWKYE